MEQHKRIHTGERPFRCAVCNKSFRQRSVLIVHRKIHTGEKPFECFICFRRFYGSGDLKTHMGTHTGVRPHNCPLCSKSFPRPSSLQAHMQSHLNKLQDGDAVTAGADMELIPEEEEDQGELDDMEGVCAASVSSQRSPGLSEDSMIFSCLSRAWLYKHVCDIVLICFQKWAQGSVYQRLWDSVHQWIKTMIRAPAQSRQIIRSRITVPYATKPSLSQFPWKDISSYFIQVV